MSAGTCGGRKANEREAMKEKQWKRSNGKKGTRKGQERDKKGRRKGQERAKKEPRKGDEEKGTPTKSSSTKETSAQPKR
jgi:hypothetical protein